MPSATALAVSIAPQRARPDGADRQQPEIAHSSSLASLLTRSRRVRHRVRRLSGVAQGDVVDDLAVTHDQHPVGVGGDPGVVGHQHGCLTLLPAEPGQQRHDLVAARPVEVAGRLVREEQGRRCGQGAREGDPLLLATGDLLGTVALEAVEVELLHERVHPVADHLPRELPAVPARRLVAQAQRQRDVLGGGQRGEEVEELEDHADVVAPECRSLLVLEGVDVDALDRDRPAVGWLEAAEHVEQRALPAAARTHDGHEVACCRR